MAFNISSKLSIFIMILILILFVFILIIFNNFYNDLKHGNFECSKNPLNYGVKQIEKINYYPALCSCSFINSSLPTLFFNSSTLYLSSNNITNTKFNLSTSFFE